MRLRPWPPDLGVQAPCAAQLPYSLVRRSPVEDEAMARALAEAGAGVVASFCLEGGILSGKYRDGQASGRAADVLGQPRSAPALAAVPALTGTGRPPGGQPRSGRAGVPACEQGGCERLVRRDQRRSAPGQLRGRRPAAAAERGRTGRTAADRSAGPPRASGRARSR